jgi:hypothetical protein
MNSTTGQLSHIQEDFKDEEDKSESPDSDKFAESNAEKLSDLNDLETKVLYAEVQNL